MESYSDKVDFAKVDIDEFTDIAMEYEVRTQVIQAFHQVLHNNLQLLFELSNRIFFGSKVMCAFHCLLFGLYVSNRKWVDNTWFVDFMTIKVFVLFTLKQYSFLPSTNITMASKLTNSRRNFENKAN